MHTLNAETHRMESWANTLMSRLGIRLISASAQSVHAEMPIAGNTQPQGYLHGGASAALAETVASHAAQLHAHSLYGEAAIAVGVELSISHVSPGRGDLVRARATAVHLGKSSTVHTVTITDEHDQTLAVARVSNRLLHS